jgi:hypothetical protein
MLEGSLTQIAANAAEYNARKADDAWLDENLMAGWFAIALGNGLAPSSEECLGWKIHPLIGGAFDKANLQVFNMKVYQLLMGQLHRQLQGRRA